MKTMLRIHQVKVLMKKEFTIAILNLEEETYLIYIIILFSSDQQIYPS